MKKILLLALGAAISLTVLAMPHKVSFDKMPKKSQEFVEKYFPSEKIISVELDRRVPSDEKYTVYFANGNEIAFDGGSGDCSQIVMKQGAVPEDLLPAKMKNYLYEKYPMQTVTSIERTRDGYRLGLSSGSAIFFDHDGKPTSTVTATDQK